MAHHFSSDTLNALPALQTVTNEAAILHRHVAKNQADKEKRLARASGSKIKITLKTSDHQFHTANTLEEMKTTYDRKQALDRKMEDYKQQRIVQKMWYTERTSAITTWREAGGLINGVKVTQKQYLHDRGFTKDNVPSVRKRPGTQTKSSQTTLYQIDINSTAQTSNTEFQITLNSDSSGSLQISIKRTVSPASIPRSSPLSGAFPDYIPIE